MAFVKHGDEQPIESVYGNDGQEKICKKCKKPMTVIAVEAAGLGLKCTCDDLELD